MISTITDQGKFHKGAGLSGYIAEISAAFVCADLGIEHDPRDNTATYVENWLKVLKQDSRAVITAAAKAQAVADYLRQFSSSTG
ncbi:zincin-like metallopeptidase domain-containing protein [Gellertiella hungarica]|uniref:Antirestriction protein ArdC n=1 Tax=Gellertiella hungarica TaxID=1572859 RepID=A0A7W6J960_9HYPH|nr:antirestriction protein ArdC [Gellertiella hungarica]